MAKGKKRTVYLYEVIRRDSNGDEMDLESGFWKRFHDKLVSLKPEDRRIEYRGRRYAGRADTALSPAADYFYFGKARPGADWPDVEDGAGDATSLQLDDDESLVEPIHMLPYRHTNQIATVRTSGGPLPQAVEAWIEFIFRAELHGGWYELHPVINEDVAERLKASTGAAKLEVKTKLGINSFSPEGIEESLHNLESEYPSASMDVTISFGQSSPGEKESGKLLRLLRRLSRNTASSDALRATLLRPGEDGHETRDKIDFLRDRVKYTETFGASEDRPASTSEILHGLSSALRKYSSNTLKASDDELE